MRILPAFVLALIALATVQAAAPPVLLEALAGRQVFPTTNWWNQDVTSAPVDTRSTQLIDWISGRSATNTTEIGRAHV